MEVAETDNKTVQSRRLVQAPKHPTDADQECVVKTSLLVPRILETQNSSQIPVYQLTAIHFSDRTRLSNSSDVKMVLADQLFSIIILVHSQAHALLT